MKVDEQTVFGAFRVDLRAQQLLAEDGPVALRAQTWAVLRYLLEHSGELVTRDDLIASIWAGAAVSDDSIGKPIRELRRAFGDDPRAPRYIETVQRRGYRFIAKVERRQADEGLPAAPGAAHKHASVVGRQAELRELQQHFAAAQGGVRQVVLLSGDAGIGKTTLIEEFLRSQSLYGVHVDQRRVPCLLARAQCIEQHMVGGGILVPIHELLSRLFSSSPSTAQALRRHAPAWVRQIAGCPEAEGTSEPVELAVLLREATRVLEAVAADVLLVVVLEDLHWADAATIDLISTLACGQRSAKLLLLGSTRVSDLAIRRHPLATTRQQLLRLGRCAEISLQLLHAHEVTEYVEAILTLCHVDPRITNLVYRRTNGHPMFMAAMVEALRTNGALVKTGQGWQLRGEEEHVSWEVPQRLQDIFEHQLAYVGNTARRVLDAAAVLAGRFNAAAVARVAEVEEQEAELCCDRLSRQHSFLARAGEQVLANGNRYDSFSFRHSLYEQYLLAAIPSRRRQSLHMRAAAYLSAMNTRSPAEDALLAAHLERGGDTVQAVTHLKQAAERYMRKGARQGAADTIRRALDFLAQNQDPSIAQDQERLSLLISLAAVLLTDGGILHPELEGVLREALTLGRALDVQVTQWLALYGLSQIHQRRCDVAAALEITQQQLAIAAKTPLPYFRKPALVSAGYCYLHAGRLAKAQAFFEEALTIELAPPPPGGIHSGLADAQVMAWLGAAHIALLRDDRDSVVQLCRAAHEAVMCSQERGDLLPACTAIGFLYYWIGEDAAAGDFAKAAVAALPDNGMAPFPALAAILCALTRKSARRLLVAIETYEAAGFRQYSTVLWSEAALVFLGAGKPREAKRCAERARQRQETSGELMWAAEILRVSALIKLAHGENAEGDLLGAVATAKEQGARLFERRAQATLDGSGYGGAGVRKC